MDAYTPIEKTPLEELRKRVADSMNNVKPMGSLVEHEGKVVPNEMLSSKAEDMLQLAEMLSQVCKVRGTAATASFIDPTITLAQSVKRGDHDDTPTEEDERILQAVDQLAVIWEGHSTAQAFTLAYNAMLFTVFNNPALYHCAFEATKEWLSTIIATMKNPYMESQITTERTPNYA